MTQSRQAGAGRDAGDAGCITPVAGVLRAHVLADHRRLPTPAAMPPAIRPSLERVAALAAARAASRSNGLDAAAVAVVLSAIGVAELPELLPDGALIAIVETRGERLGVVALCPAVIASLIEMQAVGRLTARPAPPRRATRTDAALAAGFVNLTLGELEAALTDQPLGGALTGWRYASYLDDPRPLDMMLEDGGLHCLTLTLRLGPGGERTGTVLVAVPGGQPAPLPARSAPAEAQEAPQARASRPTLAEVVQQAPVAVSAVLCRRSVSLRDLRGLQPGAVLSLPRGAMGEVALQTGAGQVIASGKLGEADGQFAVRLSIAGYGTAAGDPQPFLDLAGATPTDIGLAAPPATVTEPPMADLESPDQFREGLPAGVPVMATGAQTG